MMLFSRGKRREREAAERLYAACVRAARQPGLYRDYRVPDTLQGRFEMMALHLFALLHRLMHQPGDDPALARLISERFVADMDAAFREMGVGDISVPKRMKTLYSSFAGRVSAYEEALKGGESAIVAAVARNVFPDGLQDRRAVSLAQHLASTVEAIRAADLADLRRGEAPFPMPLMPQAKEPVDER
jgi:cytochrome b pre-mRNA-processing protein 3